LFFASIDTVPPTQTHEIERKEQGHGVASVRKVVVYEFMCLDGVAENIAGIVTGWDDDEVDAAGAAVIATQDAVILGLPRIRLAPIRSVISPLGYLILDYGVIG
jgi:hypothetical protein